MRQADGNRAEECRRGSLSLDERGTSFMTVMVIMLMTGTLGVAALTMTGLENSMAGAIRMVEEGTSAAESCVGMSVNVIQSSVDPGAVPAILIAPAGPVPAANAAILSQEINGAPVAMRNNPDVAVGAGNAPNLTMTVNNYLVNGDIDFLYSKQRAGSNEETKDFFYRVDCTAANAATGATSRVIAVFDCLHLGSDTCQRRAL
ncbi:MAG: hypothetical protein BVN29_04340 [Nitrospira sp. ST-bin5]|nr:MAG: hypothetical protein BVN29_04340 [Nitrospira sp. ST-bin5]